MNGLMVDFHFVEVILLLKEHRSILKRGIGHCKTTISDFDRIYIQISYLACLTEQGRVTLWLDMGKTTI